MDNPEIASSIFGKLDENIKYIEKNLDVRVILNDGYMQVLAKDEKSLETAKIVFKNLLVLARRQKNIEIKDLEYLLSQHRSNPEIDFTKPFDSPIVFTATGKAVRAKTYGQKKYIEKIAKNDICFGIGPAGTGKTYLAVAMAVRAFKEKQVNRIILTRPAVEAGESLGYLPGDMHMKVDPYLRPLYDAIFEMLGADVFQRLLEKNTIEVAPLAYMRGRTLDNAFIILDEAQNTTNEQMKMFLTRLGHGSKAIVTGDVTQIDLKKGQKSGLISVTKILKDIKGIEFVYLDKSDIVRHDVVQRIIEAYERAEIIKDR